MQPGMLLAFFLKLVFAGMSEASQGLFALGTGDGTFNFAKLFASFFVGSGRHNSI